MTEMEARQKVVKVMVGWIGFSKSNGKHKVIIDTYNKFKPKPSSYKVTYKDAYCATGASAAAITAGFTDIIPLECSCGRMIKLFKKIDRWVEDDAFVPQPGDYMFYDWDDDGKGDNKGWPDHVGIVEKIVGNKITVVECNMSGGKVGRRTIEVNAKKIRGYGIPDYSKKVTVTEPEPTPTVKPEPVNKFAIGDIVKFTGNIHYSNSGSTKQVKCKGGLAKVTAISKGKHKYHLISVEKKCSVYGWVDECFVTKQ